MIKKGKHIDIHKYKLIIDTELLCTLKEDMCNGDYCDECIEEKHEIAP